MLGLANVHFPRSECYLLIHNAGRQVYVKLASLRDSDKLQRLRYQTGVPPGLCLFRMKRQHKNLRRVSNPDRGASLVER